MPKPSSETPGLAWLHGRWSLETARSEQSTDPAERESARKRAMQWAETIERTLLGQLEHGSRTPLAGVPAWLTPTVLHGGFASGNLAAGGPLLPHEMQKLGSITAVPPATVEQARLLLNSAALRDPEPILECLRSGRYAIHLPEEGALATVHLLAQLGRLEQAQQLAAGLLPYFDKVRFYPAPSADAQPVMGLVHLQTADATARALKAIAPHPRVLANKQAAELWLPLYDEIVQLHLDWMQAGDLTPALQTRAKDLQTRFDTASQAGLPRKFKRPGAHGMILCSGLQQLALGTTPDAKFAARIRHVLDCYIAKRGTPDSASCQARRQAQRAAVGAPLHAAYAQMLSERLAAHPPGIGLQDRTELSRPANIDEAQRFQLETGAVAPLSIQHKARFCIADSPSGLVEAGVIVSAEMLAGILPQLTSFIHAGGLQDPRAAGLYAALYRAFTGRRSLILFNYASQVRFQELPWVAQLEVLRRHDAGSQAKAGHALRETFLLAVSAFPQQIFPNKLLREMSALAKAAGLELPLCEELAVDIFMGEFGEKFLQAAHMSAELLTGSLYARYYAIDYAALPDMRPQARGRPLDFAAICRQRAGSAKNYVVQNGKIIEQQQILTTHNLAVLYSGCKAADALAPHCGELAYRCLSWLCARYQQNSGTWHSHLIRRKNTAYAWRNMLFWLALMPPTELTAWSARAQALWHQQPNNFRKELDLFWEGLQICLNGGTPAPEQRYLAWVGA